jgi:hypothetical protein
MAVFRHDCAGTVHDSRSFHAYSCQTPAKYEEGGKWWCHNHAPSRVAAKRAARDARWTAEADAANTARAKADARAAELTALLGRPCRARPRFDRGSYRVVGYDIVVDWVPVEVSS